MKNRLSLTVGALLLGCVCSMKADICEDLEKANEIPDEKWVEKARLYISAFDKLYTDLVNKWKEFGGKLRHYESPFILYAWKNNEFVETAWAHVDTEQNDIPTCGMHFFRGSCCYPCVQCFDDTGVEHVDCFDSLFSGTPLWCCAGPISACCCIEATTSASDYFTLHIYNPICQQWLYPLLDIKEGNCKKLYDYWMHNFCEPVADLLQKILKHDFVQFSAEQLDTVLNLYRVYYNADNHLFRGDLNLCLLPYFDVIQNTFNNKFATLIINNVNVVDPNMLQYLAIVLALNSGMTDESLGFPIYDLEQYKLEIVSIFKILSTQNAIRSIQIHPTIKSAFEKFLIRAKQEEEEANANQQGIAAGEGFVYAIRRIYN